MTTTAPESHSAAMTDSPLTEPHKERSDERSEIVSLAPVVTGEHRNNVVTELRERFPTEHILSLTHDELVDIVYTEFLSYIKNINNANCELHVDETEIILQTATTILDLGRYKSPPNSVNNKTSFMKFAMANISASLEELSQTSIMDFKEAQHLFMCCYYLLGEPAYSVKLLYTDDWSMKPIDHIRLAMNKARTEKLRQEITGGKQSNGTETSNLNTESNRFLHAWNESKSHTVSPLLKAIINKLDIYETVFSQREQRSLIALIDQLVLVNSDWCESTTGAYHAANDSMAYIDSLLGIAVNDGLIAPMDALELHFSLMRADVPHSTTRKDYLEAAMWDLWSPSLVSKYLATMLDNTRNNRSPFV